jgi:DNA replication and repair protein RecF
MYWDDLLITAGNTITQKREDLITYINDQKKALFSCSLAYDKSVISAERLSQYADAELGAGVTLVGPHRDDVQILMESLGRKEPIAIKSYGSRGQQRLAVLQLKLLQLVYMREHLAEQPVLLLDDIFSELDDMHINHILEMIHGQQTIITTTHKEFIKEVAMGKMIELENNRIPMD